MVLRTGRRDGPTVTTQCGGGVSESWPERRGRTDTGIGLVVAANWHPAARSQCRVYGQACTLARDTSARFTASGETGFASRVVA